MFRCYITPASFVCEKFPTISKVKLFFLGKFSGNLNKVVFSRVNTVNGAFHMDQVVLTVLTAIGSHPWLSCVVSV